MAFEQIQHNHVPQILSNELRKELVPPYNKFKNQVFLSFSQVSVTDKGSLFLRPRHLKHFDSIWFLRSVLWAKGKHAHWWTLPGFLPLRLSPCSLDLSLTLAFFHSDKVQALSYAQHTRQLISCGGDGGIVVWNMDVERQEVGVKGRSPATPMAARLDTAIPAGLKSASASPPAHFLVLLWWNH